MTDQSLKAFEAKYANDQAVAFKITARRNKLLGLWAAEILDVDDAQAYARDVIASDFEEAGDADVIRKVEGDFKAAGKALLEGQIAKKLAAFGQDAKASVAAEME